MTIRLLHCALIALAFTVAAIGYATSKNVTRVHLSDCSVYNVATPRPACILS